MGSIKELEGIHASLMELMRAVHGFCMENGIRYSLSGGSLLGAIRHQGFIPWDDDLDLMLDRENYERFLEKFSNRKAADLILERDQWVYRVRKEHRIKGYIPSIDLFVVDKVPESKVVYQLQLLELRILQGMLRNHEGKGEYSLFYRFCIGVTGILGAICNKERLFRLYDRVSQRGRKGNSGRVAIFDDRFHLLSLQYGEKLMEHYTPHTFEDAEFLIMDGYQEYLRTQFGDYMKLPPKEERIPQHLTRFGNES